MINYYRPQALSEALELLKKPNTIPLAGGTYINTKLRGNFNLVDLQNLGLNDFKVRNNKIAIGSTTKLQHLWQNNHIPDHFRTAIKLEAPLNIRNLASIGGLLLTCNGRSPIATSLLALDAFLVLEPDHKEYSLTDFFELRSNFPNGSIITSITFSENPHFCYAHLARTPSDQPIVCAALSTWKNGRTRLALGGFGKQPLLVADGDILDDIATAAFSAFTHAQDDWASAEYRSEMARILTKRCISFNSLEAE